MGRPTDQAKQARVVLLSGGVGGARLARGLAAVLVPDRLTVVVNVGDDDTIYGVHVSPDLDTVVYTLAGLEGPGGWGRARDTFAVMDALERLAIDTTFRLGDSDLALNLARTRALADGEPLSAITGRLAEVLGVRCRVLPATDDRIRTKVRTEDDEWIPFQEYFVMRGHRNEVTELAFEGAEAAKPAPGVEDAIAAAELVVIAPSNPPLSIWPVLAVPGVREAVADKRAIAVSPLFGGKALKGPADRVMASLGLPAGNRGVIAAYEDLLDALVIDQGDAREAPTLSRGGVAVLVADTQIAEPAAAASFATWLLESAWN